MFISHSFPSAVSSSAGVKTAPWIHLHCNANECINAKDKSTLNLAACLQASCNPSLSCVRQRDHILFSNSYITLLAKTTEVQQESLTKILRVILTLPSWFRFPSSIFHKLLGIFEPRLSHEHGLVVISLVFYSNIPCFKVKCDLLDFCLSYLDLFISRARQLYTSHSITKRHFLWCHWPF